MKKRTKTIPPPQVNQDEEMEVVLRYRRKPILNQSQQGLWDILETKPIALATGDAGTGKTYAAMAWGRHALARKQIDKIVFIRSPMEMGKTKLGFLPGSLEERTAPYHAAMFEIAKKLGLFPKHIETVPLCLVQGRTFERCLIVADEVQVMDMDEYRALITRMGKGSVMILCGDPQQDTRHTGSMPMLMRALEHLPEVGIQHFDAKFDNMRHPAIVPVLEALKGL